MLAHRLLSSAALLIVTSLAASVAHAGSSSATPVLVDIKGADHAAERATTARRLAVYSTWGATAPVAFNSGAGYVISGPASQDGINAIASFFTPATTVKLSDVAIAVSHDSTVSGADHSVVVTLHADAGLGIPGDPIYSWSGVGVADSGNGLNDFTYISVAGPAGNSAITLQAGTTYWISLTNAGGSDFRGTWYMPVESMPGYIAYWSKKIGGWAPLDYTFPVMTVYGYRTR